MIARLIFAFASMLIVAGAPPRAADRAAIIAYVFAENDLIDPATIAADKLTHINYAFANIKDGQVVEGFARDAENFKLLADLRRAHPHLKLLISVGGWTWSGGFSDAVLTPESRRRFVESAVRFVRPARSRRLRRGLGVSRAPWDWTTRTGPRTSRTSPP